MTHHAFRARSGGLLTTYLLLVTMALLVAQAALDSLWLWGLFVVAGFATFVSGVVTAALGFRQVASDAERLDELEPLPPEDGKGER